MTDFNLNVQNPSDVVSPAQAALIMDQLAQGDTSGLAALESGEPIAAPVQAQLAPPAPAPAAPAPAPEPSQPLDGAAGKDAGAPAPAEDPANTVVLAKDGKHTIGYDKLVEARSNAATAKAQADQLAAQLREAQTQLATLTAAAAARADAGLQPTQTDKNAQAAQAAIELGVDPEVFGDWSPAAMARGVQQVAALATKSLSDQVASLAGKLQAMEASQAQSTAKNHYEAIYAAHPDADSIMESQQLDAWIKSKPSFVQGAYRGVFDNGSQADVIALFTTFKSETGQAPPPKPGASASASAAAAEALANAAAPNSLTDIPGGARGPANVFETLDNLSGAALADAIAELPEAQRNAYINRAS